MAQPVKRAGEWGVGCPTSDWHKPRTAPDIRAVGSFGSVDIAAQRIARAERHRHQLQLVRVVDGGRVFGSQHRVRSAKRATGIVQRSIGINHDPVVARRAGRGGENEAGEIGCGLHRGGGEAGYISASRRTAAYAGCNDAAIPVAVADRSGVVPH